MEIATSKYKPDDCQVFALDELKPLIKVVDPTFFTKVMENIADNGLNYPLIVHKVDKKTWEDECTRDSTINSPPIDDPEDTEYMRIQCGNNRWVALKELGYTHVECAVCKDRKEAEQLCYAMRKDKRWKMK